MEDPLSEGVSKSPTGGNGNLAGLVPGPSFSTPFPRIAFYKFSFQKFIDQRCFEEREERLKNLTINHKQSMAKATPVRTTKLAYVESVARAPRGIGKAGQVSQAHIHLIADVTW